MPLKMPLQQTLFLMNCPGEQVWFFWSEECCMVQLEKGSFIWCFIVEKKIVSSVCLINYLQVLSFKYIVLTIQMSSVRKQTCWTCLWHSGWEKYLQSIQFQCRDIIQDTQHFQINLCLAWPSFVCCECEKLILMWLQIQFYSNHPHIFCLICFFDPHHGLTLPKLNQRILKNSFLRGEDKTIPVLYFVI